MKAPALCLAPEMRAIFDALPGSWVRGPWHSSRGKPGRLPKPDAGGCTCATSACRTMGTNREVARADVQGWQAVCGALRVNQVALGVNTQELGSGCQQEEGSEREGHWETQCPWLGPQVPALRIVTKFPSPPVGVTEVSVACAVGRGPQGSHVRNWGTWGNRERW